MSGTAVWLAMAGRERKRGFVPLDVEYLNQDSIRELGQEFGPAGPLLLVAIIAEAKRYAHGGGVPVSKQGTVEMRYRAAAVSAFLPGSDAEAMARDIIDRCIALGLLERLSDDDPERFHVRLLKWSLWEPKDAAAADRKRRQRDRREGPARDAESVDW